MGIYDRDYYRREGPSFLAAITDRGKVCKWLILVNVACYVAQWLTLQHVREGGRLVEVLPGPFTEALILNVDAVLQGQVWRLLTYAFLHDTGSLWHILFNMLFLWWFGKDVEDLYGPREFLAVYLTSAVLGGVAFVLGHLAGYPGKYCLGASGAVTTVMVLCACHYPTRLIYFMFFLPVPIWLFVGFQVVQDVIGLIGPATSNTAFSVHLGGAAFAFAYYKLHWRIMNVLPSVGSWRRQRRSRARLRLYREDEPQTPVQVGVSAASDVDEQLEARMDAVLKKVADHGLESLTEQERNILLRASEAIRRKKR